MGAALLLREAAPREPAIALIGGVTPSPSPPGVLATPRQVPFPDGATAVIPHDFFPLGGGHAGIPCTACHGGGVFTATGVACHDCHTPPPDHFPGACANCHVDAAGWELVVFDHAVIGLTDCDACHAPPPNHFPGACRDCHQDTTAFANVSFAHTFPLNHGDAGGRCQTCHVGNVTAVYSCTACHDGREMEIEHADKDIFNIDDCVACHADGQEPDDD